MLNYTVALVFSDDGDRFTFNSLLIVVLMYLVVPHNSHATKSIPTPPPKYPKSRLRYSTHLFGQNLTISYPNSYPKPHNKIPHLHTFSPLSHLTTLLTQTLINSIQIKKISSKTPHSHNTPVKIFPNHKNQNKPQQNSTQTPNNTKYT